MAKCPNCSAQVAWDADMCGTCQALFAASSAWRPIPQTADEAHKLATHYRKGQHAEQGSLTIGYSFGYSASAASLSFSLGLLVGYPSAAVKSAPGVAPNFALWFAMAVLLGFVLSIYSVIPKKRWLMEINWLTLPAVAALVFGICAFLNPAPVLENAGWVVFFAVFTAGAPFWLPVGCLVWHTVSCFKMRAQSHESA